MKSKVIVEVLREEINESLKMLSNYFSTPESKVVYSLEETTDLNGTNDKGDNQAEYGLMINIDSIVEGEPFNKKLWLRRYPIKGSLNDLKAGAFRELYNVVLGTFLINATRANTETLKNLSTVK